MKKRFGRGTLSVTTLPHTSALIASHSGGIFLRSGSSAGNPLYRLLFRLRSTHPPVPREFGERGEDRRFFFSPSCTAAAPPRSRRFFFQIATRPYWERLFLHQVPEISPAVCLLVTSCSKKQSSWKYLDGAKLFFFLVLWPLRVFFLAALFKWFMYATLTFLLESQSGKHYNV